jgi:hypothetical protein
MLYITIYLSLISLLIIFLLTSHTNILSLGNDAIQLTATAVSQIFEENITYGNIDRGGEKELREMDYKAFLDFVLATDNKNSDASLM